MKPKYYYLIRNSNIDYWIITIDDNKHQFVNPDGNEIEFYDTKLQYIKNPTVIETMFHSQCESLNVDEYNEDTDM